MSTIRRPNTVVTLILLVLTACARGGPQPGQASPSLPANATVTPQGSAMTGTDVPAATLLPGSTPNPTETARAIFAATSLAISSDLATQGVPADQIGQYSQATLEALGMLAPPTPHATATSFPVPFPVATQLVPVEWSSTPQPRYYFADPGDLRTAQQAYERYLDFISFRDGPPPENLGEALAQYFSPNSSHATGDCGYSGVLAKISGLVAQGYYLRLTLPDGVKWDEEQVSLFLLPGGLEAAMETRYMPNLLIEQVEIGTGKVIKQNTDDLASNVYLDYDFNSGRWALARDDNGFYCNGYYSVVGGN